MRHILFEAILTWIFFKIPKQKIHPNGDNSFIYRVDIFQEQMLFEVIQEKGDILRFLAGDHFQDIRGAQI
jgi:hypothetical protein